MAISDIVPWRWGGLRRWQGDEPATEDFNRSLDTFHREIDQMFANLWRPEDRPSLFPTNLGANAVSMQLDQTEDDKAFHVAVELPGMDEKDIEVSMADGVLTIRGEKKQEDEDKGKDYYRKERSFGSFRRSLAVPGDIDESRIKAAFKKGVLTVDMPKSEEAKKKVKRIEVETA